MILNCEPNIPLEYYYDYVSADAKITLHIYSGDVETASYDNLSPVVTSGYDNTGTECVTNLSYGAFSLSSDITRIGWTSSSSIIASGNSDVPAKKTQSYRPYIKLNRDGLNALTLEYYFVDSNDNKIDTPESVSDVNVNIWGYFNELSADLISRYPAQILAVVLPEIYVQADGVYTFRIPTDNITPKGTKIFMHTNIQEESYETDLHIKAAPQGITVASSDATSFTEDYSVVVTVDASSSWKIISDEIYVPEWLKYSIEQTDSNGNILVLRITANPDYDTEDETLHDEVEIGIYNSETGESSYFGWHILRYSDDTGMDYYTDEGTELEYISGDEYINAAVYLNSGTYAPVITAKATSSDIKLIREIIRKNNTPAALTLTASTVSMSITLPTAGTVTLTPANAIGSVTYTANQSWVTFSGNTAALRPTAAGLYSVVITARDSGGRTAAVTVRVTVTAASSASDDLRPTSPDVPVSPDVRPVSPDQPAPVSPDVRPTSPDQPVPTPTTSGDTTGGSESASAVPSTPSVSVQDTTIVQRITDILNAIVSFITGDTEIAELPEESVGSKRSIADVSEEELASIPEDETPAVILPIIVVEKPAVYVFGVDLSDLDVGARIFLRMMAEPISAQASAVFYSSEETTGDVYTFLDDDGNETEVVPANKHVNVAAYMEPEYTYAPMITTKTSSSEGGDTPGSDTPGSDTPAAGSAGSSGGGCDSGFSFMALAVLGLLAKKRFVK